MKISLLVNYFPPEIGSASDLFYQLALAFNKRGHFVKVFTVFPRKENTVKIPTSNLTFDYSTEKFKLWKTEIKSTKLHIYRMKLFSNFFSLFAHNSFVKKMEHIFQPLFFLLMIPKIFFSDLILIYSPPLMLGYVGSLVGKVLRIPTIVNIQDIHPQAVADLGLIRNPLMLFMLECIERQIYHNSTSIVVHSDGNKKLVIKHGANPNKVLIIHNISEIPSDEVLSSGNQFRKGKKIDNTLFVVTYAGIMSYSQDLKTIILAAKILANTKKILFCLAGNGPLRKPLESLTGKLGLNNVRFLPFQSGDDYWKLLSASDVCMVSLKKSTVKTPVVPRKLGDIMAAGKPVIANVPYEGDVKNFINKAKCGVMVESENPELLANVIFNFSNLKIEKILQYGHKGRLYALENFSSEKVSQQYECLFNSLKKQM